MDHSKLNVQTSTNDLKKSCEKYFNEPHLINKFIIINKLKKQGHPSTHILQRLIIFSIIHHDIYLENWFLQCVKKLLEDPNTIFSCPEGYEDIFDDDSIS